MDATPSTKTCTACKEEKPVEEFAKDLQHKDGRRSNCKQCANTEARQRYQKNSERVKAASRQYYKENTERAKARSKRYHAENPEKIRVTARKWDKNNPEKIQASNKRHYDKDPEKQRARRKQYARDNPDKINAKNARRHAAKLNRSPSWADKKAILEVYRQARALQEATGEPYHVDHIYPLQGEKISGLHVDGNLRAVPARVNLTKSNKFDPNDH